MRETYREIVIQTCKQRARNANEYITDVTTHTLIFINENDDFFSANIQS